MRFITCLCLAAILCFTFTSTKLCAADAPANQAAPAVAPASGALKDGDFVAVIGDSITEQRLYCMYIEDYLLMCKPAASLRVAQFGWSGETSWGFVARMDNDCLSFHPTVATTCYGMNDGGYGPLNPATAENYRKNQTAIVQAFKKSGVRFFVLGSPGAVDTATFRHSADQANIYNKTLGQLGDIDKQIAAAEGVTFADVHNTMIDAMAKAKAKYGDAYEVAGGDGVHPGPNGHLIMAYAFLKALGVNGDIGTITVDLAANKAQATEGHKILSAEEGAIKIESSRYPFCFSGDPKSANATSGIIEFFPFNQDLNRFQLVVKNPGAKALKVTWGKESKNFSAASLEKGINLAAEFIDNPFCEQFNKVQAAIAVQQAFETEAVKHRIHDLAYYVSLAPDDQPTLDRIRSKIIAADKPAFDAAAALATPVTHTLKIEPGEMPDAKPTPAAPEVAPK